MANKSPFLVKQEFISPLLCEDIVDMLELTVPDIDLEEHPLRTVRMNERAELILFDYIEQIIPEIEDYYDLEYKGTEQMVFEWYTEECDGYEPHCENSSYIQKKWMRTKDRDLTGVIFLSDYQERVPFDNDFEVYGGKLEFAQHGFGFNPQRGTLIIFPSVPHFINNTTEVLAGDLYQVRFHIAAQTPYAYNPKLFPGDYRTWFNEVV